MIERQIQRIQLLFSQNRFQEAETALFDLLQLNPDVDYLQYLLAIAKLNNGKLNESSELINMLCEKNPGDVEYIELKAELEIAKGNLDAAEDTVQHLLLSNAEDDDHYFLMARIKYRQRNYDKALEFCDLALSINPDNIPALNLSMTINSQLGNIEETKVRVAEALQRNPENPYTIANLGLSLLNEGKVNEALEKFRESLSLNPENDIAKYGMTEAIKSKFWPYKMLYQFGLILSRLSGKNMWIVMLGAYFGVRFLERLARNSEALQPYLTPLIYFIVFIFIMTWILDPVMNIYLLFNRFGKFLLDKETKISAQLSATSLGISLISLILNFLFNEEAFFFACVFFFALLIPLGTMFKPHDEASKKRAIWLTSIIAGLGFLGLLMVYVNGSMLLLSTAFIGIFAYQWIINGMMIRDSGRRFDS